MEELAAQLIEHGPYIGVFVVLMLTGLGLPLPEDIPLLVGGYLCYTGHANIWIMVPFALITVVLSDAGLFWIGRTWGYRVTRLRWFNYILSEASVQRAERAFQKHGGKTLFLMRFVPGVRAAAFFTAGAFKLPFWKLLVFDGGAALISVPTLVLAAFFFGAYIDDVQVWARNAGGLAAVVIVLGVGAYLALHLHRKRKATPDHQVLQPPRAETKVSAEEQV